MESNSAITFCGTNKIRRIVLLLSPLLLFIVLMGCQEKTLAPYSEVLKKVVGTCEVYDKLPGDITRPLDINYGNKIKLLGISANKESQTQLRMSYYWQIMEDPSPYNAVFVVFNAKDNNKQVMGNDHYLCQNHSFGELRGKFVKETYTVIIADPAVGKRIDVGIGLFGPDLKTNSRLGITSAGKTPVIDGNTRALAEELNL